MAFFKKLDNPGSGTMAREKIGRMSGSGENGMSIIGPGMNVSGDLVTDGTVRIEGRVEGTVRAAKGVVLGREGEVIGDIVTQDAVIGGRVSGTVLAESRLELQSTAVIDGEIRARAQHLQLDEGARFNGQIRMIDEGAEPMRALPAEASAAPRER
ncbi:polymer-forming cytoskeletal protein [soil metagenome]